VGIKLINLLQSSHVEEFKEVQDQLRASKDHLVAGFQAMVQFIGDSRIYSESQSADRLEKTWVEGQRAQRVALSELYSLVE